MLLTSLFAQGRMSIAEKADVLVMKAAIFSVAAITGS